MDVAVVGCGVIGLTTAVRLQEAGLTVRIVARDLPLETTSNVAAAIWYPYRAYPQNRVLEWGRQTITVFEELAATQSTGIRMREVKELFRIGVANPWWMRAVRHVRHCDAAELPAGFVDCFVFTTPVIEMPIYLSYLLRRFQAGGGVIEQRAVGMLAEVASGERVIVHCTGVGAKDLVPDTSVTPIRGQVVCVDNPGIDQVLLDEGDPDGITYIVPRSTDCILGGTAEVGADGLEPDPEIAREILHRCAQLEPRLHEARVLSHKVGLRPGRPSIRLETVELPDARPCVHNYGHGGAGVTLSWGCADEVVRLVGTALA
ncbi:MAG TPA: FAD-dependent oxidoreductase [Jiangellaceae bacterium]|nr:FAD-dependent oxidoreductase [Jiangellaceae bacterium]